MLEEQWSAAFSDPPQDESTASALLRDAAETLALLIERGDRARAKALAEMIPEDVERHANGESALALLNQLATQRPDDASLRRRLRDAYRIRYQGRRGLDRLLDLAGLYDERTEPAKVIERLARFLQFEEGALVRHASWGAGNITKLDRFTAELVIDFAERKRHRMTPEAAVDTLELLAADDFDAIALNDPARLIQELANEPLSGLKRTLRALGGRTTLPGLRDKLKGPWIEDGKWLGWWGLVRKLAHQDPFIEVTEGKPIRLALREQAKSAADEALEQIAAAHYFRQRWEIARRFFRNQADGAESIWLRLEQDLNKPMTGYDDDDLVAIIDARKARGFDLKPVVQLRDLPNLMSRLMQSLQRELAECYLEDKPVDVAVAFLADFYEHEGCRIRGWIRERLLELDPHLLAELDDELTHDPMSAPQRYVDLVGKILSGRWQPSAATADPLELAIDLMQCARSLEHRKLPGKQGELGYEIARLLLADDARLVISLIEQLPQPRVERAARLMHETACLGQVMVQVEGALLERLPNLQLDAGAPFWQRAELLVSQTSLERRKLQLIDLMDVELPKAEKAIGEAMAFGDLRENSEYTAALERRDQLVDRIERMKRDVNHAQTIESQPIDETLVCPGTRVKVRRMGDGKHLALTVLGPWDVDVEAGVISYLSPLAAGLLGSRAGAQVEIELPDGRATFEVLSIERAC